MQRFQTLTVQECLSLLGSRSLGRVAYTERALPAIRPVNYALVGTHLVLRTRRDGLAERLDGQVVAFEIDDGDAKEECGWSVVVTGTARVLLGPSELVRFGSEPFASWAGPDHATAVQITPGDVTGRRLLPALVPVS